MVNAGERNVPDTPTNRKFNCLDLARQLAIYSVNKLSNTNKFPLNYHYTMTAEIVSKAKDVYRLGKRANDIYVESGKKEVLRSRFKKRIEFENEAIFLLSDLLADINIAKSVFHIRGKTYRHWASMVINTKEAYKAWRDSEVERLNNNK